MARMGRPGLSDQEKSELWRRWQAGQSLTDIGLALGKHAGSVHGVISLKGGIAPTARTRAPEIRVSWLTSELHSSTPFSSTRMMPI
jgi:hypothetical protein